jgi:non-specific serine/threonine protein kinase
MLDSDHDVEFVDLSLVTDATLVPQTVATALRLQDTPEQSLTTTLAAALRTRRMLLVLDNCEHVLAGAADLVDQLLASCPELRVLATSREALHLPGEVVWSVPPLSLPEDDVNNPTAASRAEAVRLFVVRAKEVQPRFALTAENVGFVTCHLPSKSLPPGSG